MSNVKIAVQTALYLQRNRLRLTNEEIIHLVDEVVHYFNLFQKVDAEVIAETRVSIWNTRGEGALEQLSETDLLDMLEEAQRLDVDSTFIDELYKALWRKQRSWDQL